jgi:catechol 2,3-dioxygenase-like lactoylglutathione lyase family enzyme
MLRQIAPVFFTMDIPATLAYYTGKLGFECLGTWQDPPVYAIVARDQRAIQFRCAEPPTPNPVKYVDELLDAYGGFEKVSPTSFRQHPDALSPYRD